MRSRPPWLDEAERLQAEGMNTNRVAKELGLSFGTVAYHLHHLAERRRGTRYGVQQRYRNSYTARYGLSHATFTRLRKDAREEAKETGTPVLDIYKRWEILLEREKDEQHL